MHRLWAQAWLAELASCDRPDSAAMIALGKRYGVVTQGTSLLVLDRIEDYVRYRVEPKEAPLLAEYRRLIEAQPKVAADPGLDARMQSLLQRWKEFRDYHAASYPGIESLLLPLVQAEASSWPSSGDKAHVAGWPSRSAGAAEAGGWAGCALAQGWCRTGFARHVGTRGCARSCSPSRPCASAGHNCRKSPGPI